eukprot:m.251052 g.251052  ORF g.251052 m.251052 type:complete len:4501 (+) comp17182_c0_seq1:360-13862(+)
MKSLIVFVLLSLPLIAAAVDVTVIRSTPTTIDLQWQREDYSNFQVYEVRDSRSDAKFGNVSDSQTLVHAGAFDEFTQDGTVSFKVPRLVPDTYYNVSLYTLDTTTGNLIALDSILAKTAEDVPAGPPLSVQAQAINSTHIRVSWQPPALALRNGIITNYTVAVDSVDSGQSSFSATTDGSARMIVAGGLKPYTRFSITVSASTSVGKGPSSFAAAAETAEDRPATAPINIQATPRTFSSIRVSWDPPVQPNGVVYGYNVRYRQEGKTKTHDIRVEGAGRSFEVTGLSPATRYEFTVNAYTRVGAGPFANYVTGTTNEAPPSNAPASLTAAAASPYSISLAWSTLTTGVNGQLTGYQIRYVAVKNSNGDDLNESAKTINVDSAATVSYTVASLEAYTTYHFAIAAKTAAGVGVFSTSVASRTAQATPDVPMDLSASTISNTSILLMWEAPVPANGVVFYTIRYRESGNGAATYTTISDLSKPSYNVTGLQPNTVYDFEVQAFTQKANVSDQPGQSTFSTPLQWSTDFNSPFDAPSQLSVTALSATSLQVSWSAPQVTSGPVANYLIKYFRAWQSIATAMSIEVDASVLSQTLTNLNEYTIYEVRVYALVDGNQGAAAITRGRTEPAAPVGAPTMINATSITSTTITLAWEPPVTDDRNGIITAYTVYVAQPAMMSQPPTQAADYTSVTVVQASELDNSLKLTQLTPNTGHWIAVSASTVVGEGPLSTPVFFASAEAAPAVAPSSLASTRIARREIDVEWLPLTLAEARGVITTYTVYWKRSASSDSLFYGVSGRQLSQDVFLNTSFTITDLIPSLEYDVRVSASTAAGKGPLSDVITFRLLASAPGASPRDLQASVDLPDLSVNLTWLEIEPRLQYGTIAGYIIRVDEEPEPDTCESIVCDPSNDCQIATGCKDGVCVFADKTDGAMCGEGATAGACLSGVCLAFDQPSHTDTPRRTAQLQETQYSYGAGYMPKLNEYWFPSWSSSTIYRFDSHFNYITNFVAGGSTSSIKQLWGEPDSLYYYTANWGNQYCAKLGPYPLNQRVWTYSLGYTAGGVSTDEHYMYCMPSDGNLVHVVNKTTGEFVRHIALSGIPNFGTLSGGVFAVVQDKIFYGISQTVYRFDLATGNYDNYNFGTEEYPRNMFFNGQEICVGDGSSDIYCYQVLDKNIYNVVPVPPRHLDTPTYLARYSINTYSYGGGFNPVFNEFWWTYNSYSPARIYVYRRSGDYSRYFYTIVNNIRQLFVDTDGSLYVASNAYVYRIEYGNPQQQVWAAPMQTTVGGVSVDEDYVYAMLYNSATVYVLGKESGSVLRTFNLDNPSDTFSNLRSGFVVVQDKIIHCNSDSSRRCYRYHLNGTYDGTSFSVSPTVTTTAFNGRDMCMSDGDSNLYCYQLLDRNVYDLPSRSDVLAIQGSNILTEDEVRMLSDDEYLGATHIYKLCYSGTQHGFSSSTFHSRCDNLGATISVMKINSDASGNRRVFGGYISDSWWTNGYNQQSEDAWLYRIYAGNVERTNSPRDKNYAFYSRSSYCPSYGSTSDLRISSNCRSGYSNPSYYTGPGFTNTWLAGASSFYLDDIEVFYRAKVYDPCDGVSCIGENACQVDGQCVEGICYFSKAEDGVLCDDSDGGTMFDACDSGVCRGYSHMSSDTNAVISSLMEYQNYAFRVSAYNEIGLGPFSPPVYARLGTGTPSGAPRLLTTRPIRYKGKVAIQASWRSVDEQLRNGEILGYKLEYRRSDDSNPLFGNVSDTFHLAAAGRYLTHIITDLEEDVKYEVHVLAYTAAGDGPWSDLVTVTTVEAEPSDAPLQLQASITNSVITVTWKPPSASQQNGDITGYTLIMQPLIPAPNTWAFGSATFNATTFALGNVHQHEITIHHVSVFLAHEFRVAAKNALGQGPLSPPFYLDPEQVLPSGKPLDVNVTLPAVDPSSYPPTADELIVSWRVPEDIWIYGTPIEQFEVMAAHETLPVVDTLRVKFSDRQVFSVVLNKLAYNTVYNITVRSVGFGGFSVPSDAVISMTRPYFPSVAPTGLHAGVPTATSVNLSWNAVNTLQGNGDIIGYRIHYNVERDTSCEGVVCPPAGQCLQSGRCNYGECVYEPKPNGTVCDDESGITTNDRCYMGVCEGERTGQPLNKLPMARHLYLNTRSYGAAFVPQLQEYWFPSWSGSTIYRYDDDGAYFGAFTAAGSTSSMMQIWAEPDSLYYYTANWNNQYCAKLGPYPTNQRVWTYSIGTTAGGVATDDKYMYCVGTSSSTVHVVDKQTGQFVRQFNLQGGSISTLYGTMVVADGKLYYGTGRVVYRHNLVDGQFDGFSFGVDVTMTNMVFDGRDICVSGGGTNFYCYQVFSHNVWTPFSQPDFLETVTLSRTMSMSTYSYAGGFFPPLKEFWYPSWASSTIYRLTTTGSSVTSFTAVNGASSIRQIWGDESGHYYLASTNYIYKALFPSNQLVWLYDLGTTAGGVSGYGRHIYAMTVTGRDVFVLNAATGQLERTVTLDPLDSGDTFTPLYGGLLVVYEKLFRFGESARTAYRYNLDSGKFDNSTFSVALNVRTLAFDGDDVCISDGGSTVYCYTIMGDSIYDIPVIGEAELIEGSRLLSNSMNQALSQNLPARYFRSCFLSERDGFSSSTFHQLCDKKGPTVVVARLSSGQYQGRIFGGFTRLPWQSSPTGYQNSNEAFLFKFEDGRLYRTDDVLSNPAYSIYNHPSYGPTFGNGHDLYFASTMTSGYAYPSAYTISAGTYSSTWLVGERNFQVDALEVFYMSDETYDPCTGVECPASPCQEANACLFGQCVAAPLPDGTPCDDSDNTTHLDSCIQGACIGTPLFSPSTTYTVEHLEPGRYYGMSVQAYTAIGGGPVSEPIQVLMDSASPWGPAKDVTAEARTSRTIVVSWHEPDVEKRNGRILGYKLYRNDTNLLVTSGLFFSYTVHDLLPYQTYSFYVVAFNSRGDAPRSAVVKATTKQDTPGSPINVVAFEEPDTEGESLTITWSPPPRKERNGVIIKYTVHYAELGGTWLTIDKSVSAQEQEDEQTLAISGLSPLTSYRIKVTAWTMIGQGADSRIVTPTTGEGIPRSAPANVTAEPVSKTSIQLSFKPPPTNEGAIVGYTLFYRPDLLDTSCATVTCEPLDQCHVAGVCREDEIFGPTCSHPIKPDGTACNDGVDGTLFDVCVQGTCRGVAPPNFLATPARTVSGQWTTYSYGMGYAPRRQEWWFPQYTSSSSGTVVYRFSASNLQSPIGSFTIANKARYVTQIWPDVDDTYLVGTYTNNYVYRLGPYPLDRVIWSYYVGATVGGVAADDKFAYVMRSGSNLVTVLSKDTGNVVRQLTLFNNPASFGTMYGTMAVVQGKLYYADTSPSVIYRFDLQTGAFDGNTISTSFSVYKLGFDGQNICVSDSGNNIECWRVLDSSVYGDDSTPMLRASDAVIRDSKILSMEQNVVLSSQIAPLAESEFTRCFRASEDGWSAGTFHNLCDNKGPTITIAHTSSAGGPSGRIFGGYSPVSWNSYSSRYYEGIDAFLFRFNDAGDFERTDALSSPSNAIYSRSSYCPTFGGGHDLHIDSTCRRGYTSPSSYTRVAGDYSSSFLAGSYSSWTLDELEVFYRSNAPIDPCADVVCSPSTEACTIVECVNGQCVPAIAPDGLPCNDRNSSSGFDSCLSGECVGQPGIEITDTQYTFTDLHIYTEYSFVVAARTQVGIGPGSDPIRARTLSDVPTGEPLNLLVGTLNSSSLRAQWNPPALLQQRGKIIAYRLEVTESQENGDVIGTPRTIITQTAQTTVDITSLQPFRFYKVTVAATTPAGTGPRSEPAVARTGEGVPSDAPLNVQTNVISKTSVVVSWTAISPASANGYLLGYVVSIAQGPSRDCQRSSSANEVEFVPTGIVTSMTVSNLEDTSKYAYEFQVAARTSSGAGVYSAAVIQQPTTSNVQALPCVAPSVMVEEANVTSVRMHVVPPSKLDLNGNRLLRIEVDLIAIRDSNDQHIANQTMQTIVLHESDFAKPIQPTNLLPYTVYSVQAVAVSSNGSSPVSTAVTFRTLQAKPSVVRSLSLKIGSVERSIQAQWLVPYPANGIVSYHVDISPSVQGFPTVMTADHGTIYNLLAGTTYNVSVSAMTSGGRGPAATAAIMIPPNRAIAAPTIVSTLSDPTQINLTLSYVAMTTQLVLQYRSEQDGEFQNQVLDVTDIAGRQTSVLVSNLLPSTAYMFRIQSNTATGLGRVRHVSVWTKSIEPDHVTVNVLNNTAVLVAWQGDAPEYRVVYKRVTGRQTVPTTVSGLHGTNAIVTGFNPAKLYKLYVEAVNPSGASGPSAEVEFKMNTTICADNTFEFAAPFGERDRVCKTCKTCQANEWMVASCSASSDTSCRSCSICGPNIPVTVPCSATQDTVCGATTTTRSTTRSTSSGDRTTAAATTTASQPSASTSSRSPSASTPQASTSASSESGPVVYAAVGVGVLILIALIIIAVALLRRGAYSTQPLPVKRRPDYQVEITNPVYMMSQHREEDEDDYLDVAANKDNENDHEEEPTYGFE